MNIDPRQFLNLNETGDGKVVTPEGYVYDPNVLIEAPMSEALDACQRKIT